jgi:hypothetical protein
MPQTQDIYRFPPLVAGTTLKGQQFVVEVNDAAPDNALSDVDCVFYKNGVRTLVLAVGDGITINNAALWTFTIGPVDGSDTYLEDGEHTVQIRTTDSQGTEAEYVKGIIKILPTAPLP